MKSFGKRTGILLTIMFLAATTAPSQDSLPTLQKKDYDQWQTLRQTWISEDGTWTAWRIDPVEGNDSLFIRNRNKDRSYKFALASNLAFTSDSKWAAFRIGYSDKELKKMREKKQPVHYKVKLLDLGSGREELFEDISSFRFSEGGGHLAMEGYAPKGASHKGKDLILRNLKNGRTRNIGNVSEWAFNKNGNYLAYIIDAEGKKGNGVELFRLAGYQVVGIDSDTATYRNLEWEKKKDAFAFYKATYDSAFKEPTHMVFAVRKLSQSTPEILKFIPEPGKNMPDSMRIRETYKPEWSQDLSTLFVGIREWTPKEEKDKKEKDGQKADSTAKAKPEKSRGKKDKDEELPGVDIWHWKDDPIQPRQKKTYSRDKNFTYLCAWNLDEQKLVRLTGEDFREARLTGNRKHALTYNRKPYQPQFRLEYADYELADVKTGLTTRVLTKFNTRYMYGSSPDGKFLLYFKDQDWWTYEIATGEHVNLTKELGPEFWNTRDDLPIVKKPPFGSGGWFRDDKEVLLYDEYDVWAVKPDGSGARKLTSGRDDEVIYRVRKLNREEDWLDPKKDLYFSMFGDRTKKSGYARMDPKGRVSTLIYRDKAIHSLSMARSAPYFIFTSQSYEDSPDVFLAASSFKNPVQLSETNPQQKKYAWGRAEPVEFTNTDGKKLQGLLHYPANYQPGRKYPMIVYIYEIRSNGLHYYVVPSPRSSYNITNYVQQGYFFFQPDIVYKTNHPGESAVNCVVPAVKKVLATGMIDEHRIGLMGHSWGAYQTAFIITQTDLFSAAVAGAPLTDLISMYNSIYWNSGSPDQRIFETSQGRFDQPYWEIMDDYVKNSPMFQAGNITAPLLVAFGDADGAVDWHQGIELYITMRRMQKSMIMLVYAGENHGLRKEENQEDYTTKVNQFFNHHLLGEKAPEWIEHGVTYLEKKEKEAEAKEK